MLRPLAGSVLMLSSVVLADPAAAEPVAVRYTEGVARGFPVLKSTSGETLAHGDLSQVVTGDRVENRLVFRFKDGSVYDETVVFTQNGVFRLESYKLVQRGASFPESLDAHVDRATGRYVVRYQADQDSAEEVLKGKIDVDEDVSNGLLMTLMKNLPTGSSATVQILAFTPKPRHVKMLLAPVAQEPFMLGDVALPTTRYAVRPQLGLFASLLVSDLPDVKCWIVNGAAPAFVRFEGPLYFMGPVWRIELN